MWACPKCAEESEDDFEVCWACGTGRDGSEDPSFVAADDAGPVDDPAEEDTAAEFAELESEFGEALPDLADCFVADDVTEARFVADQLRLIGIPAVSDRRNMNVETLGGWVPQAWGYGPRVRVRPRDHARARAWVEEYLQKRKERRAAKPEPPDP